MEVIAKIEVRRVRNLRKNELGGKLGQILRVSWLTKSKFAVHVHLGKAFWRPKTSKKAFWELR